ncbi:MAG: UvrD-helicase domain-containing protein [Sandaracinaceae bacterium]|nr:UvrD-helicase domain-containing protein [Sandaracinaceae bacterium]
MATVIDEQDRHRIATDLDASFVVEAAAGTGKTTALIGRIVAILARGRARLDEIVALTFTTKAAGEMKLRLRGELERARAAAEGEERARLTAALGALEAARIGTIHSFCQDMIFERPVEAGIDPAAEIVEEEATERLVERALDPYFEACLEDPPEGIRRLLRRRGAPPRRELARAARELVEWRDHDALWRRPEGFDREGELDELVEHLVGVAALAKLARDERDELLGSLGKIARFVDDTRSRERARPRDYDGMEADLRALRKGWEWSRRGRGRFFAPDVTREDAVIRRDEAAAAIDAFLAQADAELAALLFRELRPVVEEYARIKARAGKLDFLDLLLAARDLLRRQPAVLDELRARYRRIFVDEFQDTDPVQAEILAMLASEGPIGPGGGLADDAPPPVPGKLFVVGDPKQAIYGFRRADVALYQRLVARWTAGGVERLTLSTSFRAGPNVQRVINTSFAPHMTGDAASAQARYVPLAPHRADPAGRPSVIALGVPEPYLERWARLSGPRIRRSSADVVAAFVAWLLESDWTFEDPSSGETRRFESRDVCLLFRNTTSFGESLVEPYALALEARAIPHVVVGGRSSRDREEILAMANAVNAIERPDDTLSVYATLRGPLFGLTDDALLVHREAVGPLHPLAPLGEALLDEARRPVAEALDVLRRLHLRRNRRPIAETLGRMLDATRAHAGIANWLNGEQALANALRVVDLAHRFEASGGASFRAFATELEERVASGAGVDAPVVEEREEGVRVMTVHAAKGLELPVVVLCDPTLSRRRASLFRSSYVDSPRRLRVGTLAGCVPLELKERAPTVLAAEEAEEVRLAYVAATRARELLVVPCVGDAPFEGWVDPLHEALYPAPKAWRDAAPAPGCPPFGGDSVVTRPLDAPHDGAASVAPGLHRVRDAEVVWWDPSTLGLGRVSAGGLRRFSLLAPGEDGDARVEAYHAWVAEQRALRERAAAPSWRVAPVTQLAYAASQSAHAPAIESTDAPRQGRPSGKRFGTLVHEVLAACPLDAREASVRAMARYHGRGFGAPDEEVEAAVDAVLATLGHPRLAAARASREVRRECPITVPLEDGTSAEGVIDLAYRAGEGWVVLDYKSDRDAEGGKLPYVVQLELYARALHAATGEPVETVLLYV